MKRIRKNLPLLVAIIFGLTPVLWFWGRPDVLINGNDTNFPLNPYAWFERRFYIWNDGLNGGVEAPTSPAGLFFHSLQVFFYSLTNSLQLTELLTFIFWFTAIPLSFYLFLRLVFKRFHPLAAIVGMTFYTYNIYLFNIWENVKVANLALVVGLPALLGLFIYSLREGISKKILAAVAVVGFVAAGSGINPSYFAVFILVFSLYLLFSLLLDATRRDKTTFLKHIFISLKFFAVLVLANFFWILPLANKLFFSGQPVADISQFGLVNWLRGLSQNTSVLNILRLRGAWDWYSFEGGRPLYIPYAPTYFNHPFFIIFSFLIPILVFVAVLLARQNRKLVIFFGSLFTLGIFFGVGAYGTLGSIYIWFSENVPFFSFFRSPWYVFTPLTTISISVLIFSLLNEFFKFKARNKVRHILFHSGLWVGALGLLVANLFYTYPQVTGKIFRPGDKSNTFLLAIPDYVYAARDWLSGLDTNGRILSFPNTPIERFEWGYTGIDSIIQLISNQNVIYPFFGGSETSTIDLMQGKIDNALKRESFEEAVRLASLFSVEHIFIKRDVVVDLSNGELDFQPDYNYLSKEASIFGSWEFYPLQEKYILPRVYIPKKVFKVHGDLDSISDARILEEEPNSAFFYVEQVGDKEFLDKNITASLYQEKNRSLIDFEDQLLTVEDIDDADVRHREKYFRRGRLDPLKAVYTVEVDFPGEYEIIIDDSHIEDYGLGEKKEWEVFFDGERATLTSVLRKSNKIYFKPLFLIAGRHQLEIPLPNNPNLLEDGSFEEGKWLGNSGVSILGDSVDGRYALKLSTKVEDVAVRRPINNFDPYSLYMLSVDYKREFGPRPAVLIRQSTGERTYKSQTELLSLSREWAFYQTLFRPEGVASRAEIAIFAYGNSEEGTSHLYDDLSIRRVFNNKLMLRIKNDKEVASRQPTVSFWKISPTRYQVAVENTDEPHFLVFSETFNKGWKLFIDGKPVSEKNQFVTNGYANGWYIDKTGRYDAIIEYTPQRLFVAGFVTSGATVLSSIGFLIYSFLRRKRK